MSRRVLTALVALGLAGCSGAAPTEIPARRAVMTAPAGTQISAQTRPLPGTLQSGERASISFETGGIVTRLDVELGDTFAKGALLGQIDDRAVQLELDAALAELRDAKAQLEEAELAFQRRKALEGTGAVSQTAIDQAEARFESAASRVEGFEAQAGRVRDRLEDTRLLAPFDGEVAARRIEPGEVVSTGQPVLDLVNNTSGLEAVTHVPDRIRTTLESGQPAQIEILPLARAVSGHITEIGRQAGRAGLYPVTVTLAEDDVSDIMKPGQAVEIQLSDPVGNRIVIPVSAYGLDGSGQAHVFTFADDGQTLVRQPVMLGTPVSGGIEILGGLEAGTLIVTRGADLLSDGDVVDPITTGVARYNR